MDFDNRKVYGDTSITDGLVLYISLLNYQMWVRREEDNPYQSIEEQLLSIDEVEVFRGQKNRLVLLL